LDSVAGVAGATTSGDSPGNVPASSADEMWAAYCQATGTPLERERQVDAFGDTSEMADELVDLVLGGVKRATACLLAEYGNSVPPTEPGDLWIVLGGDGRARGSVQATETRTGPFGSADAEFAYDEGEGDRTLEHWRAVHRDFFARRCELLGITWSESLPVLFQRFEVVWPRSPGATPAPD
jgi:uncharacterized protein YhfF